MEERNDWHAWLSEALESEPLRGPIVVVGGTDTGKTTFEVDLRDTAVYGLERARPGALAAFEDEEGFVTRLAVVERRSGPRLALRAAPSCSSASSSSEASARPAVAVRIGRSLFQEEPE